nr:translation initiation factor IF-2-like [Symphalangus syndactylus]
MGSPRPSEAATPVPSRPHPQTFPHGVSPALGEAAQGPEDGWPREKIPKLQLSPTPLPSSFHPPFPPPKLGGPIPPPGRGVSRTLRGPGARRCPPGAHGAGAGAGRPGGEGTPDLRRPRRRRFPLFIQSSGRGTSAHRGGQDARFIPSPRQGKAAKSEVFRG